MQQKKLLVLGNCVSSIEIIKIAKSMGAFVIASDNLKDSSFKKYADRSYDIIQQT